MKTRRNKIEFGGDIHSRKVFENIFKVLQQLKESFKSWLIKK
jgi:hypothetical protein